MSHLAFTHTYHKLRQNGMVAGLLGTAILLTLWMAAPNSAASSLFQSPQSPPPEEAAPPEVPPVEPVQPAPAPEQPAVDQPQPAPVEQPAPEQAPAQEPAPTHPPRQRDLPADQPAEETGGGSNFILDQAELIDTMVVSGARLWMCCGILFFLLIPVLMLIIYIRGRSKLRRQGLG